MFNHLRIPGPVYNTRSEHCPGCVYKGSMKHKRKESETYDVYLCNEDTVIIYFDGDDYLTTQLSDLLKNPHPLRIDTCLLLDGGSDSFSLLVMDYYTTHSIVSQHAIADWCEEVGHPRAKEWRLRAWLHQMIEKVQCFVGDGHVIVPIPDTRLRICLTKERVNSTLRGVRYRRDIISMTLHLLYEEDEKDLVLPNKSPLVRTCDLWGNPVVLNDRANTESWYLADYAYAFIDDLSQYGLV